MNLMPRLIKQSLPSPTRETAAFVSFVSEGRQELRDIVDAFLRGEISKDEAIRRGYSVFQDLHSGSVAFGRWRAGVMTPLSESDIIAGMALADEQVLYWQRFMDQIEGGGVSEAAALNRADMYAARARGTAGESFVRSADGDELYDWILTEAEHCPDCPFIASLSPWRGDELGLFPGSGETQCLCIASPESRVLTMRGWIPIADVLVGDLVLTHRGRWMPVVATPRHRVQRTLASVLAPSGNRVLCTSDHKWLTPQSGWVTAEGLREQRMPVYTLEYALSRVEAHHHVREGFHGLPEAWHAEVLLRGISAHGTTLYDLTVAEDHSFIVEGLVTHNSNCKCVLRRRSDGVVSFEPFTFE